MNIALISSFFILLIEYVSSYHLQKPRFFPKQLALAEKSTNNDIDNEISVDAFRNARKNLDEKSSPGAGLETADEQAQAAYADLIITTFDQRGINEDMTEEDLKKLMKAGTMWENEATTQNNKIGIFGDFLNVFKAFMGGAHIEKNKFGET